MKRYLLCVLILGLSFCESSIKPTAVGWKGRTLISSIAGLITGGVAGYINVAKIGGEFFDTEGCLFDKKASSCKSAACGALIGAATFGIAQLATYLLASPSSVRSSYQEKFNDCVKELRECNQVFSKDITPESMEGFLQSDFVKKHGLLNLHKWIQGNEQKTGLPIGLINDLYECRHELDVLKREFDESDPVQIANVEKLIEKLAAIREAIALEYHCEDLRKLCNNEIFKMDISRVKYVAESLHPSESCPIKKYLEHEAEKVSKKLQRIKCALEELSKKQSVGISEEKLQQQMENLDDTVKLFVKKIEEIKNSAEFKEEEALSLKEREIEAIEKNAEANEELANNLNMKISYLVEILNSIQMCVQKNTLDIEGIQSKFEDFKNNLAEKNEEAAAVPSIENAKENESTEVSSPEIEVECDGENKQPCVEIAEEISTPESDETEDGLATASPCDKQINEEGLPQMEQHKKSTSKKVRVVAHEKSSPMKRSEKSDALVDKVRSIDSSLAAENLY